MNRETLLDTFRSQGVIFIKAPYLNGQPRVMGRDEADTVEIDIVGTPGYMRSASIAGAWNDATTKARTLEVLHAALEVVNPDLAAQLATDIEAKISEAEAALNRVFVIYDANRMKVSIQVIRFPGARVLMTRFDFRLMDVMQAPTIAKSEKAEKDGRKRHHPALEATYENA